MIKLVTASAAAVEVLRVSTAIKRNGFSVLVGYKGSLLKEYFINE